MTTIAQPLRAIWILNWLDFAVCNGSLLAYFFNTHGRRATLAAEVLRALGAHRMADVLTAAERSYRSAEVAWAARHQELSELGQYAVVQPYAGLPNADELGELTDRYWQAAELDNWGDTLEVYLREQVFLLVPPRRSETSALGIEPTATDQVDGWIFEENVGRFLTWVAHYVGYAYDHLDEQALVGALDDTDDESDCWYEYPLVGTPPVTIRLARSAGSSVVMAQVRGQLHGVLAARIDTLLNVYATAGSSAPPAL